MIAQVADIKRVILVRMNPGVDVLLELRRMVGEQGINNGVILTGFGSVSRSHFHVVMSNDLPPAESYPKSIQPLDVCAVGGMILDGRVHAHITFSDERNGFGGHLEEGCLALTFLNIAVGDLGDVKITDWDTSKDEKQLV